MLGSLYSGITGLKANGDIMSILGNNIANVNTVGFKKSVGTFFDILSTSLSGGGSNMQIGRGTYMGCVKTEFLQGAFERTESVTDLAIEGDGFFALKNPNPNEDNLLYTRNGQFIIDKDGFLTTTDGMRVQGYMLDPVTAAIDYTLETDIQISNALASSSTTSDVGLGVNLDADAELDSTGAYSTTLLVYDSQGREIPLTFTFTRTATNGWNIRPSIGSEDGGAGFGTATDVSETIAGGTNTFDLANDDISTSTLRFYEDDATERTFTVITSGTPAVGQVLVEDDVPADGQTRVTFNAADPNAANFIAGPPAPGSDFNVDYTHFSGGIDMPVTFDNSGRLTTIDGANVPPYEFTVDLALITGAVSPQTITVNIEELSQYASPSTTKKLTQNGYGAGELRNLEVSTDGFITGHFTNGLSQEIGRLFLGHFRNLNGLSKVGETRYVATRESGQAIHNTPGSGLATIDSHSLELANVDMAAEFVRLITAQRAFSANSKVVSTSDTMLGDLMNIKR